MSHIFLYGPPGTGKSTIGKILAQDLNLPFFDLDDIIESNAGMSIAQIMSQQGEPAFRDMETAALRAIVGHASSVTGTTDRVIALGGGALLREENRVIADAHGTVVVLTADLNTLLQRLENEAGGRPLLAGDVRGKLTRLLAQRQAHYSSFPLHVEADGGTASQNAFGVQARLGRFHLEAMGEYDVLVDRVENIGSLLMQRGLQTPIVVTDENVAALHAGRVLNSLCGAGFSPNSIAIPAGEAYKTVDTVQKLWQGFLENGLDRKSTIVALGGGVIGDLVGFAASTYMRGVHWVCVPTTLLSMVDASLGGKTGFDLPQGKNLVGSFHPPKLVLADPQLLQTLPEPEFISGLAEVVKHGIISDPELFDMCARGLECLQGELQQLVKRAMAVKIKVIEEDPYEKGVRATLNLGHTVGHAVELVSQFHLRHGEAVAIGMVAEARLAERLGIAEQGLSDRISGVLRELELPYEIPETLPRAEIIRTMRVDKKKNAAAIRFALPAEIGRVELVEVSDLQSVL